MSDKEEKVIKLKLKDLSKVNFESVKLKSEFEEVKQRNSELIESTKIDTESLSKRFEI